MVGWVGRGKREKAERVKQREREGKRVVKKTKTKIIHIAAFNEIDELSIQRSLGVEGGMDSGTTATECNVYL